MDFPDPSNGFRHKEVVGFINEEIVSSRSGPDFLLACRSRPWDEVEDQLRDVLTNVHLPHEEKRSCAWSGLALGVRSAARQRQQQAAQVQRLQEQVEECEAATKHLVSELERQQEEHRETVSRWHCARGALHRVMGEREKLRRLLYEAERRAQTSMPIVSQLPAGQHAAEASSGNPASQGPVVPWGAQGEPAGAPQGGSHASMFDVQGPWSPLAQAHQPAQSVPQASAFSCFPPFAFGFPPLLPLQPTVATETEAAPSAAPAAAAALGPSREILGKRHNLGPWAAVSKREQEPWDQRGQGKEKGAVRPNVANHPEWRPPREQNTWPPREAAVGLEPLNETSKKGHNRHKARGASYDADDAHPFRK